MTEVFPKSVILFENYLCRRCLQLNYRVADEYRYKSQAKIFIDVFYIKKEKNFASAFNIVV